VGLTTGIEGKTFGIQGYGNVGYWAAKFFHQDGGKITTVVEHDCAIHCPNGFDPEELESYKIKNGSLRNFPNCKEYDESNP
jgi:glutamate dehydrogenase (NAD(P)+)